MLKTFRENFRHLQWILWMVIAVFVVFVFVDWGMGTTGRVEGNEVAAQAGSYKITSAEFQKEYKDREEQYRMLYGNGWSPEMLKTLNLPEVVLNTLIDRRILREEGERLGLSVTDDEISNKILAMKDREQKSIFVKDGVFVGEGQYRRILSSVGYTPEGFEAQTRDQVLFEKLNRLLMESVFVSDDELQSDFSNRTVKVKIAYLLKANSGPAPAVDDAEAEAHFQKDSAVYSQPEKRKAKYLLVETAKLRGTINVPETDVAAEYNKNLSKYKKPEEVKARHILYKSDGTPAGDAAAKAKADAALAKLKKGEDFAKLAMAESDDAGSKQNGGDLGSFSRGRMVKEFEDAVFSGEVNALVGPVKTTYGYHIVQVLAKTEERMQPLFEVAPSIRERLKDQRAADEAKRLAQGLADRVAKLGGKLTDDQMKSLATGVVSFNESDFAGRGEPVPGIGFSQPFTKALFSLQADEASDPITTPRGEVILRVGEIKPPGVPTFQEVKQKVIADVAKKKQSEAAIQALTEAMGNAASLEQIAAKTGDKVETPESFGKNQPIPGLGLSTALTEAAFAANVGDLRGPIAVTDRGAAVFKLLEKTTFDQAAFDKEKEEIRSSIRSQKGNRVVQALIGKRRAEMRIVVNKDFLKRFEG